MLQRAASNAYSWWYASHVRTKQSKWLEQSLQDMGEKVEGMIKLISEDGDSFAKRAEMYYKRRPELINFVEESYRAYRSLAERYDHLSKELQNANTTLASAFPDQYQFPMDDDDDDDSPRVRKRYNPKSSSNSNSNIPKAPPKFPSKNIKALIALASNTNNDPPSKPAPKSKANRSRVPKSGLTKTEAINEIDKLQKQILTLQTEKEYAKSSYESGYAKYWDIDEQINGTQEKILKIQDEFGVAKVIEDDEARTLMAEAAIKSCNDTLTELQEKQKKATKEARSERKKIKDVRRKLNSFKVGNQTDAAETEDQEEEETIKEAGASKESKDLEVIHEKLKEHFEVGESASLSVIEMAEKIDELVNKVINFESVMSSQTALIHTLRSETDELQLQIQSLEDDKANLIAGKTTLSAKLGEMENKLRGLEDSFEARINEVKAEEEEKAILSMSQESKASISDIQPQVSKSSNRVEDKLLAQETPNKRGEREEAAVNPQATQSRDQPIEVASVPKDDAKTPLSVQPRRERRKEDNEPDWQHLFTSGLESKEKVLLEEYTTTLRNYKETKKKLSELEMTNEENFSEVEKQLEELKCSLAMKDEEIHSLRHKLSVLQKRLEENQTDNRRKLVPATRIEKPPPTPEDDVDIKTMFPGEQEELSPVEQKLRTDIDEILEDNLDFWMRFSGSIGQVQKFQNEVEDLQEELAKIEKSHEKKEGSSHGGNRSSLRSDVRPIYRHLREIQTETTFWLEQNEKLKEELQRRFSQLCNIQQEIKHALNAGAEDEDMKFTSYQAAKFQGEVANMQQENNKVADELQASMDYITSLQIEVERTTTRLCEELGITESQKEQDNRPANPNRVPLGSFIFGVKPQKKNKSIFSSLQPAMMNKAMMNKALMNKALMNKKYNHLKADKLP